MFLLCLIWMIVLNANCSSEKSRFCRATWAISFKMIITIQLLHTHLPLKMAWIPLRLIALLVLSRLGWWIRVENENQYVFLVSLVFTPRTTKMRLCLFVYCYSFGSLNMRCARFRFPIIIRNLLSTVLFGSIELVEITLNWFA